MENVITCPLPVWQDPQCHCICEYLRDEVFYYFKCWENSHVGIRKSDFLGLLHVKNVWAIRSERHHQTKSYPTSIHNDELGYYYKVENSLWLADLKLKRDKKDPGWSNFDGNKYDHYILESCETWTEVIGKEINFYQIDFDEHQMKLWDTF